MLPNEDSNSFSKTEQLKLYYRYINILLVINLANSNQFCALTQSIDLCMATGSHCSTSLSEKSAGAHITYGT